MKLVLMCLLAVCCGCLGSSTPGRRIEWNKLREVWRQLSVVKESLQHSQLMVNTPPQNIEDCCCLSALRCFRSNLRVHFNVTERRQVKLYKSLQNSITERGLNFCSSGTTVPTCGTCDSHPKVNAREFVNRLESLIQRAINRLSMD